MVTIPFADSSISPRTNDDDGPTAAMYLCMSPFGRHAAPPSGYHLQISGSLGDCVKSWKLRIDKNRSINRLSGIFESRIENV